MAPMAEKKRKKKPASLGCVFWIAFILLIIVLFFFNKKNIGNVLEKTGAGDLLAGKKPVAEILESVRGEFKDWKTDSRDGLWLGKGKSWVHVRASNTEPVIRVISEAPTETEAEELCARVEKHI